VKAILAVACVCIIASVPLADPVLHHQQFIPLVVVHEASPATPTPPRPVHVRFIGWIESIAEYAWVVSGHLILLTDETIVDETAGEATVGAEVTVYADVAQDGALVATRIVVLVEAGQPRLEEFTGLITAVDGDVWTIAGSRLVVPPDVVRGDTPSVGCVGHVRLWRYFNAPEVVDSVVVECFARVQFEGPIQSIDGDLWLVGGVSVVLDSETVVEGEPGVGRWAEVSGYEPSDAGVLAEHIRVIEARAAATHSTRSPAST